MAFASNETLGSLLVPLRGLTCRRCRIPFMVRTTELRSFRRRILRFTTPGRPSAAAACYVALWRLPRPDFHRLVIRTFQGAPFGCYAAASDTGDQRRCVLRQCIDTPRWGSHSATMRSQRGGNLPLAASRTDYDLGGGLSEFQPSAVRFHDPSACFFRITNHLPLSLIGVVWPGTVAVRA
jgi:hypothetical protein